MSPVMPLMTIHNQGNHYIKTFYFSLLDPCEEKKHLFMFLLSKTDQLFTHWATLFISVASLIDTRWVSRLRQKNLPILTYLMPHQTPQWLMSPERRWKHNFVCVCNKTVTCGNQKKLSATLLFFSLLLIIFIASSLTSSRLLLEF